MKYIDQERVWFWSRLGFLPDPAGFSPAGLDLDETEKFLKFHRQMVEAGIKFHTSILPSGWIGDDTYDYHETDKILDMLFSTCLDIYYIPRIKLFHFGAWTGLRFIDCVMMKWENIDFGRNLIVDCKPQKTARKTNKTITVPMHPMLRELVGKAYKWKENDYVLPKLAERYVKSPGYVNHDAMKVFKFNGFETSKDIEGVQRKRKANIYGFHSFRHSFVSFCAKAGVPLAVVQSIVGHGNPAMTRHYVHIDNEAVKQAINALPQGNMLPESKTGKSIEEKHKEAIALLNSKSQLNETETQLLRILQ